MSSLTNTNKHITVLTIILIVIIVSMNILVIYNSFYIRDQILAERKEADDRAELRDRQFERLLENQEEIKILLSTFNASS